MRRSLPLILLVAVAVLVAAFLMRPAQSDTEPWSKEQLMAPAALAKLITDGSPEKPVILSIGPAGSIRTSIEVGETRDAANLERLGTELGKLPKHANVVIYCGCCPFKNCPNIRPAFTLMEDLGFVNGRLLNLPQNLKVDWIEKGYPLEQ